MRLIIRSFIVLLFLTGFISPVFSGFAVNLNPSTGRYNLGHYLEILEDVNGTMTYEQVSSSTSKSLFVQSRQQIPNFGFSDSVFWVKFSTYNPAKYIQEYFLEYTQPLTDNIDLYYKDEKGRVVIKSAGDHVTFNNRDFDFHNFIFKLPVNSGLNTYYLRIQTTSSVTINMTLFNSTSLIEMMNSEKSWLGFYYGIMVVMLISNLFIYLSIRDINYLLYIIHIFSFIIFQFTLNGLSFQYLWPNSLWWANDSPAILMGAISLTGVIFTRNFLRTWESTKIWDRALLILAALTIFSTGVSFFSYKYGIRLGTLISPILLIAMLITGFICLKRGNRAARFYLIAWFLFLLGSILKALQSNALVGTNFITLWGQQIGAGIDVTFLSLALMDRFNIIKQKSETTQMELIGMQKQYSDSLEKTVESRTNELITERNKLQAKNKIMEYELSLARSIQEKLIPTEIKVKNIAAMYKPMILVGGDFYDIIYFENSTKIGIFISDVAGHGVQAAFITSMIKTVLLQSPDKLDDPALLLSHLNDFLMGQTIQGFVTIYYGIFDPENRTLTFANAGHPSPFIATDHVEEIQAYRTIPAGILDNEKLINIKRNFQNRTKKIPKHSKVIFYTDGLTECSPITDQLKHFDQNGMREVFIKHQNLPCHMFINELLNSLFIFREDNTFTDDICVVCLDVD
ncbi:MAG: SpoIIE family protein phosphatase [Spirochaetia bacterium]|nr:SpoIIE family protein phosphatase [Spirochaetia bacterium]